jgi:hypothetical protein
MDKYFIDKKGRVEEHIEGIENNKPVHFPLCLAVKYGNSVPMECPNFLLNTNKRKVFIETDSPFPPGTQLMLHFYIPPKAILLGEFKSTVIDERTINNVRGNLIKISDLFHTKLHRLEQYMEEERHLVDEWV